jgi:hypothetical protein
MSWEVRCEDGVVRHGAPFERRWEAEKWAWWGHICTAQHTVTRVAQSKEVADGAR